MKMLAGERPVVERHGDWRIEAVHVRNGGDVLGTRYDLVNGRTGQTVLRFAPFGPAWAMAKDLARQDAVEARKAAMKAGVAS